MDTSPAQTGSATSCLNCGHPLTGRFCGACGQEVKELRRPFLRLSLEALQSLFELDGRAYRTLYYLLTKPAHLSKEYFSGRRMRYTPPLRLFLVISVSFFLLVSFYTSIQSLEGALQSGEGETPVSAAVTAQTDAEEAAPVPAAGDADSEAPDNDEDDFDVTDMEDILAFVDVIELPFLTAETNANLRAMMRAQAEANFVTISENPGEFARGYLEYITVFMLLMMPVLALMQKIFYFRGGHYYAEHFVLTLHNHSFLIITLFAASLTGMVEESAIPVVSALFGLLGTGLYIWLWVYLFLSLKNYFQQGYGITLLKFMTTTVLYGFVLFFGALVLSAILFFLF